MGRQPTAWWNEAKNGWYVELDGKQKRLAKGARAKAEAKKELRRLLAERDKGRGVKDGPLASHLFSLYLKAVATAVQRDEKVEGTLANHNLSLRSAELAFGDMPAEDVRPRDVDAWIDGHPGWKQNTRRGRIGSVKAAFRWAKRKGHIEANPLDDMPCPGPTRREVEIGSGRADEIRALVRDEPFREFLFAVKETGCRPGEVMTVTAAMMDLETGIWTVPNKTRRATKEATRRIFLTPAMVELSRKLAARHPEGPVFRNLAGNRWTHSTLSGRFQRMKGRGLLAEGEVISAHRKGFITDGLVNEVPIAQMAELVGHKDTTMIMKVYSRLNERTDHMKEMVSKVRPASADVDTDNDINADAP